MRELRGISQEELAALAKTAQSYLSKLENGRGSPTLTACQNLADALACQIRIVLLPLPREKGVKNS
jgi:transcriptional regulator with XRE-family HTH domain